MPFAEVNSVSLNYEILGSEGPWVALVSGARRNMDEVRPLAERIAKAGFRVLLHDRRNTGRSGLSIEGEGSEFEIWADDLAALLRQLNATPVIVGGSSSGCRLATIMALRHRSIVKALLMMRVTGGSFAIQRLSKIYYGQYIDAAERGGMGEVCETDHFKELVARNPESRAEIMSWNRNGFIEVMKRWQKNLESGAGQPMLGASEQDLRSIDFPTCVVPGNDKTHSLSAGRLVHSMIPGAELHELRTDQLDVDLIPMHEWVPDEILAPVAVDFFRRAAQARG